MSTSMKAKKSSDNKSNKKIIPLDYPPIYKVNYMVNNEINTIYVFNGKQDKRKNEDEEELFKQIFSEKELNIITSKNIKVKFSENQIHFDDSIGTIKIKILIALQKDISLDELYLYCQKIESFTSVSVYKSLTQNRKLELTKVRLDQFISNIVSDENGNPFIKPPNKDIYTFDDILQMNLDNKKFIVNKVLGQKFFMVENEYPYVCDPYDVKVYDSFFEKNARKTLSTLNNHLLLTTGKIIENTMSLCLAKDVLEYVSNNDLSEETTLKIYYPFLYSKNINDISDLENARNKLVENNKKIINDKTNFVFNSIDMFYDVYTMRKTNLKYENKGIKFIKAMIKPEFDIKIPLEVLFKIIHATQTNPLIKYNPSSKQENVYRLFTDKISTDGRKIPLLKKATIFKLMKTIGKTKSVTVYIESSNENIQKLVCEFDENGYITIISEFKNALSENDIDIILRESVNPIIEEIKNVLEQSGYKIQKINSLADENVEIKQLTYETQIYINKPFKPDDYKGCLSTVFNNESNTYKNSTDINLRFKRVSNFSKVTSQEAFILEKSDQGYRGQEIIELLLENFREDLDRKQAEDLVRKVANEIQLERGVRKTEIKIKENPGFKTTVHLEKERGIITIVMENINDLNYLTTIPIYLDTMVRLTQDKNTTKYPVKEIDKLCLTNEPLEDITISDIISASEDTFDKSEIITIEDEEADYDSYKNNLFNKEKPKGAFSLFYDEDEVEEEESKDSEEEDKYGGERDKNNDSGSSVPSESSIITDKSSPGIESPIDQPLQSFSSIASEMNKTVDTVEENKEEENKEMNKEEENTKEQELNIKNPLENIKISISSDTNKGSDDDDDNESVEEKEDDNFKNIDGMKLNKPYYFQTMIEKKDPILILKEDTPQFNSYSRTCRSDMRRQPVILTDAQLEKINKEYKGFLREEDVIKYGSDPKNQYNYICPRYWCLKTNSIIDPKELKLVTNKDGKQELIHPTCGKILSQKDKQVKPGHYIYEFYGDKEKRYPGFQTDKHPDGYCLPCCFDKYNTEGRIKAKEKCIQKENKALDKTDKNQMDMDNKKINKKEEKMIEEDEYIKGPDKFPLEPGRWGYLPAEIQKILHEVNADCQISKTNTNIKPNHPCLLRHGVAVNDKQSFISCISDILFFGKKSVDESDRSAMKVTKILTIPEMKERIIKAINIDSFIKYQNGNLVTDFHDINSTIDIEKYKNTKLYTKLNMNNAADKSYYTKVISAFNNFVNYMNDEDAIINHTYLWDIICMPNKYLFPSGVNLIIFKLPHDDITNNVQILCPTNHYSSEFYEARKPTIMLVLEEGYYEPIYSYTINNNKLIIAKEFKEYDPQLSKTMRAVFKEIIKPFFNLICRPLESMPNIYKAKTPLLLYNLIEKLDKYEYKPLKLVVNFNNKVIGVVAEEPGVSNRKGFIPCYPSAIDENLKHNLDYVFMTDLNLWNTYDNTIEFLNKLEKRSKKRREIADIPCKPAFKIIEDEHVVGILTETNQFIQLSKPILATEIDKDLDLPSIRNDNYIVNAKSDPMVSIDVPIATLTGVDEERVDYIKKIKLETNFYNVFRNTIRILLNDYDNVKIREQIESEMVKEYVLYSEKLITMNDLLKKLVKDSVQFIGDDNFYKAINDISTCIVKDKEQCKNTPNLCTVTDNGKCNLILPTKNLISQKNNEQIYYGRMADELIRYNRIKSFMLQPQTYLLFDNINYNLRDNEIILIQSLLNQEYFDTLVPTITNKYIKFNSYDETEPVMTQLYENKIPSLDHAIGRNNEKGCNKVINNIKSSFWKHCFPNSYKEIEYNNINYCTFQIIIDLIEKKTNEKLTANQIKNILYEEYKKYLETYKDKITDILILEGKKTLGDQVSSNILSFSNFIYTDNYFLTTFDLWLLVQKYKIPTIFLCQKFILQTKYEKNVFLGYGNENDKFSFIIIPGYRPENVPAFKQVISESEEVFIGLEVLNEDCIEKVTDAIVNKIDIGEYLSNFSKPAKTIYEKKKPFKRLKIDSESDSEEIKKPKKNLIIEETTPISPEEFIMMPRKKGTKKNVVLKGNIKTKKNKNIMKEI